LHREAAARSNPPPSPAERPSIPYTELPEPRPGDAFFREWTTYRREIGRLLAEGHEGRFVLIKGEAVEGLYETWDEARRAGLARHLLEQFFVKRLLSREPLLRFAGY